MIIRTLLLVLCALAAPLSFADVRTVDWDIPATEDDGTPFAGPVDRTNIWCGTSPGAWDSVRSVPAIIGAPNSIDITYTATMHCMWQFVIRTADGQEVSSPPSVSVQFTPVKPPEATIKRIRINSTQQENCTSTVTTHEACTVEPKVLGGVVPRG